MQCGLVGLDGSDGLHTPHRARRTAPHRTAGCLIAPSTTSAAHGCDGGALTGRAIHLAPRHSTSRRLTWMTSRTSCEKKTGRWMMAANLAWVLGSGGGGRGGRLSGLGLADPPFRIVAVVRSRLHTHEFGLSPSRFETQHAGRRPQLQQSVATLSMRTTFPMDACEYLIRKRVQDTKKMCQAIIDAHSRRRKITGVRQAW